MRARAGQSQGILKEIPIVRVRGVSLVVSVRSELGLTGTIATCCGFVAVGTNLISVGDTDVGVDWVMGLAATVEVSCVMEVAETVEVAVKILVGDGEIGVG